MPWVLAIDFGTTATAAAVCVDGGVVQPVMLADGSATVSSSVFAQDGQFVVGSPADNLANWSLDAYEPTPKRRVGQARVLLGGREFEPRELIAAVLGSVLGEAVRQHDGDTLTAVTLTHPVSWGPTLRQVLGAALDTAATGLGLTRLQPSFVAEPVAAAHWYAQQQPLRTGDYVGVYDLGGGTFDTAVLCKTGDGYQVVQAGGIDPLGGVDFDYLLGNYLGERHIAAADPQLWQALSPQAGPPADSGLIGQRRRLQETVKTIKEQLTGQHSMNVYLPGVPAMVLVTRAEYEALITDHIEATVAELEATIADAGLTPKDLTAIYRIGGAARTPLVGDKLARLQRPVHVIGQPKLVVAQGAATATATQTPPPPPPVPEPPPLLTEEPTPQINPAYADPDERIGQQGQQTARLGSQPAQKLPGSADLPGPSRVKHFITNWIPLLFFVGLGIFFIQLITGLGILTLLLGVVAGVVYVARRRKKAQSLRKGSADTR